jgi:hypothetical protein
MVDIEKIEKRTIRSFYDDGLFEIAIGLVFLLLGGYFFAQAVLPEGSFLGSLMSALFVVVIFAGGFMVSRILRFLKRRITYPRTGYVALRKKPVSPKRKTAAAVAGAVIGMSLAALYTLAPPVRALLPAVNGLLLALVVFLVASKIGLVRLYILAAAAAVIGCAVTAAGMGDIKGVSITYGVFGAAVIVSGLSALIVYLNRSPRPGEEPTEEGPDAV